MPTCVKTHSILYGLLKWNAFETSAFTLDLLHLQYLHDARPNIVCVAQRNVALC